MAERSIRFSVTDRADYRAARWKCWSRVGVGKKDVYFTCSELNGKVKLSLHESGCWHLGFDSSESSSTMFEQDSAPDSRFLIKLTRPSPLSGGLTLACRVCIPWYAVNIPITPASLRDVFCINPALQDKSVEVSMFLSEPSTTCPGWPGKNSMNTNLIGNMDIDGGGKVWLVYRYIPLVEPTFPSCSKVRYFRGESESSLLGACLEAVVWGICETTGAVMFYETPFSKLKDASMV